MNRLTCLAVATILLAAGCGVQSPLQVSTSNLPGASLKQAYSVRLQAVGATPPFTWSVASGSLPPGVSLSTKTGMLSGTPQAEGEFDFTVQVTDVEIPSITAQSPELKIKVHHPGTSNPITLVTTALPGGTVKTAYSASFEAAGGIGPYKWTVASGSLPTGLALGSSSGTLAGTPSIAGQFSFGVQVQDSSSPPEHTSGNFTVDIVSSPTTGGPSPLQVNTTSLPSGAVQVAYNAVVKASGGTAPYTWNVVSGTIPPGLALSASGTIGGTPTQAGSYLFTAQVTDASGLTASSSLTASIAPASSPVISGISPTGGPTSGGTTVTINGSNFASGATVSFGGVAALASLVSSTQIHAVTPAHVTGSVDVSVQENGQTSTLASAFTYNAVWPTVSGISPNNGPTAGGATVTITGTNFLAGALVLFGSIQAPTVKLVSSTQIQAITPANAAGPADVTVENPGNLTAKLSAGFTYNSPTSGPPTITSISPTSGAPGTQVTITGTNFESGATVAFGSADAAPVTFVNATELRVAIPSMAAGTYNVMVTNPDPASATLNGGFTVTAPPPAQSLLSGCTVSASNQPNCSIPSGWTLVKAEGFESGALGPSEVIDASASITTTNAHTGSHAMQGHYGSDGDRVAWFLESGVLGSFNEVYISYWDYTDPNAQYGNSDYFFLDVRNPNACGGGWGQDFGYDAQDFLIQKGNMAPQSTSSIVGVSQGSTSDVACQGYYQYPTSKGLSMNAGYWRQYEIHYKPSTSISGGQGSLVGNGEAELYVNGQLQQQQLNANLNGSQSMANASIEVGGTITDFCDAAETTRAVPFSKCPASAPTPFNRYIDDIIIMKK